MAGLPVPLSTLRATSRDVPRMTRGQCGGPYLHCVGLSPLTFCRFRRRTFAKSKPIVLTFMWTPPSVQVVDDTSTLAHRCRCGWGRPSHCYVELLERELPTRSGIWTLGKADVPRHRFSRGAPTPSAGCRRWAAMGYASRRRRSAIVLLLSVGPCRDFAGSSRWKVAEQAHCTSPIAAWSSSDA